RFEGVERDGDVAGQRGGDLVVGLAGEGAAHGFFEQHSVQTAELGGGDARGDGVGCCAGFFGEGAGEGGFAVVVELTQPGDQGGAGGDHLGEGRAAEADDGVLFGGGGEVGAAQGGPGGVARLAFADGAGELIDEHLTEVQREVFLAPEVVGHRHLGDLGGGGHVGDRHLVEAAFQEKQGGLEGDVFPGLLLFPGAKALRFGRLRGHADRLPELVINLYLTHF